MFSVDKLSVFLIHVVVKNQFSTANKPGETGKKKHTKKPIKFTNTS